MSLIKFYADKFTGKNLKKALRYFFAGEFRLLFMIAKIRLFENTPGRKAKKINLVSWIKSNAIKKPVLHAETDTKTETEIERHDYTVDIIIPVYNGFEYLDALFRSLVRTDINYNVYVIDDCSTDERVAEYLRNLAEKDTRITVITNEENLGFVRSVNKAFAVATNHIALLNSDIELPRYWLERLMYPIINLDKVASATPFTNAGTLCSFPHIGKDNKLFGSLSCQETDSAFQHIRPMYRALPTGVGFCMGINKDALSEIGTFDAETFSKGFGEENDWCQRAIKAGYKNVMVENLFIYHKHCGSFTSEEKKELGKQNAKKLLAKHPNYDADTAAFFEKDPLKIVRDFAVMRLADRSKKTVLVFDHSLGGGATDYIEGKIQLRLAAGVPIIVIRYDMEQWVFSFRFRYKEFDFDYFFDEIEDLQHILNHVDCREIIVNELVGYPDVYEKLEHILKIKEDHNASLAMHINDFYSICPMINLMNDRYEYCFVPTDDTCNTCIKWHEDDSNFESISVWRRHWGAFIRSCDDIITFSNDSRMILEKVYGTLDNIKVIPHTVSYIISPEKKYKTTTTINIGLIGVLTIHKGLRIIKEMLRIIRNNKMNVRIKLIGSSKKQVKDKNFSETGKYNKEELPLLSIQNDIDMFFISSLIPETFSYTTEEAIKMGFPVAAFNIGAPVERVALYDKGLVLDTMDAERTLEQMLGYVEENPLPESPYLDKRVIFVGEYISFSSRYRVEHFREQLLLQGVASDYIDAKKCDKVIPDRYSVAVIYRCRHTKKIDKFIKSFKGRGQKVYYDIDDLTFDYDRIKDLAFLLDEEYSDFELYTRGIQKCMSLCDGFITSTDSMRAAIKTAFPNVPVVINRNVASLEMACMSLSAVGGVTKNNEKVTMGYFSGSKTHDGDFAIIARTLTSLLEKYDNLCLSIVGCLTLPDIFNIFAERICVTGFIDWRKLPEMIASVDINLMPLEDTFFHACKSENKWMEAALVAVPTVCSFNNELSAVIEDGGTGFLCRTEDEWSQILSNLIENPGLRDEIGKAAHDVVLGKYITTVSGKSALDFILQ